MKNLVAKAGVAAVTSVLLVSVASVPEAKAADLKPSTSGSLAFGSRNGVDAPELRVLNIVDPEFLDAGAVEVGEFVNNETRGYFEYDLTSLASDTANPFFLTPSFGYTVDLGVFSDGGTGSAGSSGNGSNLNNPFDGTIKAFWYLGSALDSADLAFNPTLGPSTGGCFFTEVVFGLGGCDNPLEEIDMSTLAKGDSVEIDVSNLVKELLLSGTNSFGIMLQAIAKDGTTLGVCGTNAGRVCEGVTFTSGLEAVPTPAAILPTLFGLASAAFSKKRKQESEA